MPIIGCKQRVKIGDCREVLRQILPNTFTAVVTDPPYELGFMGKRWDKAGVAFDPETWRAVLRVAKPGAFLLAFGGTRTYHRMVCAIEDAGWIIHPMLAWVYGQGFPKATNLGKMIERRWERSGKWWENISTLIGLGIVM